MVLYIHKEGGKQCGNYRKNNKPCKDDFRASNRNNRLQGN